MNIKEAIKEYQCPGCVCGSDLECGSYKNADTGQGCGGHVAGTMIGGLGTIFLGLFTGFNRLGPDNRMLLTIFETQAQQEKIFSYDMFNIPTWKYRNEEGHIFIRGLSPRINRPFLHVILKGNFESIKCLEITKNQLAEMD